MIVTFLQLYRKKQKTLGQLLLDFLELYGIKFDFEKVAMTVLQGGACVKSLIASYA
jgi:DNA polymerase sigma